MVSEEIGPSRMAPRVVGTPLVDGLHGGIVEGKASCLGIVVLAIDVVERLLDRIALAAPDRICDGKSGAGIGLEQRAGQSSIVGVNLPGGEARHAESLFHFGGGIGRGAVVEHTQGHCETQR